MIYYLSRKKKKITMKIFRNKTQKVSRQSWQQEIIREVRKIFLTVMLVYLLSM